MLQFLSHPCRWIKSKFVRNPSPLNLPQKPAEIIDLEYENLFMELLEEAAQGSSWGEIQGFLIANNLDKQRLTDWLRRFGERWLEQPANDLPFAEIESTIINQMFPNPTYSHSK